MEFEDVEISADQLASRVEGKQAILTGLFWSLRKTLRYYRMGLCGEGDAQRG